MFIKLHMLRLEASEGRAAVIEFGRAARAVTRRVEPDGEKAEVRKQIVCTQRWADRIEDWRRRQPGRIPTWSEAVRILAERAIEDEDKRPVGR